MWGKADNRVECLEKAIKFTGNHKLYGAFMVKVTREWPVSCEHNLTNKTQNRLAWLGHAACALAFMCPEDITREAWGYLTKEQQEEANGVALKAIKQWELNYAENL